MAGRLMSILPVLLLPALAWAQLADPTRPPAEIAAPAAVVPGEAVPATGGLQSVILKKNGRPAALINGAVVELGSMAGESRLVKVDEDSVVLLAADGSRETLKLMPAVEKKSKVGAGKTAKPIGMNAYREEKR